MNIIFDKSEISSSSHSSLSFNAAFIHQDYYIRLLEKCNTEFNLNLLDPDKREIQLRDSAYMLISRDRSDVKFLANIGIKVVMKVSELIWSKPLCAIIGVVQLRKNFTCNSIPHIIIAKNPEMNNQICENIIQGSFDHLGDTYRISLYEPIIIKGRIGIAIDNPEELIPVTRPRSQSQYHSHSPLSPQHQSQHQSQPQSQPQHSQAQWKDPTSEQVINSFPDEAYMNDRKKNHATGERRIKKQQHHQNVEEKNISTNISQYFTSKPQQILDESDVYKDNNIVVQKTHVRVQRPEVTHSVERPPPTPPQRESRVHQFKIRSKHSVLDLGDENDEDADDEDDQLDGTGETYKGHKVYKGPRGGKYYFKNGKKVYMKGEGTGSSTDGRSVLKSGVVYKVNILGN